jgi:hypothetical protein
VLTVQSVARVFLSRELALLDSGELLPWIWGDDDVTAEMVVEHSW